MAKCVGKIFPKSLDANLSDYPQETTIHAVKYLANRSRPRAERTFWIIILIVSISFLGYFVYKIGQKWLAYSVMLTDENNPTQIFEIPFPAVTICPQVKFKHNKFNLSNFSNELKQFANLSGFIRSDFGKKYTIALQICRKPFLKLTKSLLQDTEVFRNPKIDGGLPNDWFDILHDMSPNFEEVFEKCEISSWEGSDEVPSFATCERLFSTIITNEGVCFTFNSLRDVLRLDSMHTDFQYHNISRSLDGWDPETGYFKANAYPYKGIVKGSPIGTAGLKLVLNANLSDATPFCYPTNIGYKIALHSPSAFPQIYDIGDYISIAYGKDYKISVIPKVIKTDDDLRSLGPEVRNCYYNDERKLKFYTFYNEDNCRLECYANYSMVIHKGVPFSSPRDSNTSNCILPNKNFGWELPEFIGHFYEHFKVFGSPDAEKWAQHVNCNCLPECNAIHYGSKILKSTDDFSVEVINEAPGTVDVDNVQTTIEIMFNEPTFIGEKRVRMYTFETMISDFGGLLGLFMGGSVLSLIELFYFLTIRNCCKNKPDMVTN